MAELQTAEILQRLANLEQQNFRFSLAGVGIAALILAAFLMANAVEAQSFVLRDKSDILRATLAVDSKTEASTLVLADQSGKICAEFKVANDGIAFGDANGQPRLIVALKNSGTPDMGWADSQSNLRMGIGLES